MPCRLFLMAFAIRKMLCKQPDAGFQSFKSQLHSLCLCRYYKVGWENHGYWFVFFSIQGPLYLAESWLRHILRQRGLRPPKWAGILAVHAVLLVTAHFFFFPPAIRSNIGPQFFDSLRRTLSWLPGLHSLLSPLEQL